MFAFSLRRVPSLALCLTVAVAFSVEILSAAEPVADVRFQPLKDYDGYFPMVPPKSKEEWAKRSAEVRRQVLVSQGLWPLPTKTPLNPIVYGRVERPGYTVDRVILETVPGHFLCGSLFKPAKIEGKVPAVLSPHGHGKDGRHQHNPPSVVKPLIEKGQEKFEKAGSSIYQARCVQLARMGMIAFIYDMEGYADAKQLHHDLVHKYGVRRPEMETATNWGFYSPQAELRFQSIMGLQTWNSIRALDFITSLPEVDTTRIGVTGESGGGTQTMLLAAVDDRVAVSVPAVMVSTAMQGGCTCENCCLLRCEQGNIEFAGLFAPKPQALIAANDWTKEIMTKGLPELKELYALLGKPNDIIAFPFIQFPHNYNSVSREAMYGVFNKYFQLGLPEPIVETDYEPLSVEELTVWTSEHPLPEVGDPHERKLVAELTKDADAQMAALTPKDSVSLEKYRETVGGAVDAIIGRRLADVGKIEQENLEETDKGDYLFYRCRLTNPARGEVIGATYYFPKNWNNQVAVWVTSSGAKEMQNDDGTPIAPIAALIKAGFSVAGLDLFGLGAGTPADFPTHQNRRVKNTRDYAGYTYGFNRPLFVQRVHDILSVVAHAQAVEAHKPEKIHLIGVTGSGPLVAAAAAQCGDAVDAVVVNTAGFRFANVKDFNDAAFVPGIVKYGDVPALLALGAPHRLRLNGERTGLPPVIQAAYDAAGRPKALHYVNDIDDSKSIVEFLLAK